MVRVINGEASLQEIVAEAAGVAHDNARSAVAALGVDYGGKIFGCEVVEEVIGGGGRDVIRVVVVWAAAEEVCELW